MADTGAIDVMFGNPFVSKGWPTVLTWSATASRSFSPDAGPLAIGLSAGLYQTVQPTLDMVLALPAGLPESFTIDGRPLSIDGVMIPKPTAPVRVTFVSDITTNTLYMLTLNELVPNAGGTALTLKPVLASTGLKPEFTLPPDLIVAGKFYSLRAVCIQGGYPSAADGDLRPRSLPYAAGYLDSGVFSVMP
jgi:hypothetical protein